MTDSIDTGTPSGRFSFHVMASLAEMERELTIERTRDVADNLGLSIPTLYCLIPASSLH